MENGDGGGNGGIQTHERKRRLENRLLELREQLEEDKNHGNGNGLSDRAIEERVDREREWQVGRWKEEEREDDRRQKRLTTSDDGTPAATNSNGGADTATVLAIVNDGGGGPDTAIVPKQPNQRTTASHGPYRGTNGEYRNNYPHRHNRRDAQQRFMAPDSSRRDTNSHVEMERKEVENEKLRMAFGIRGGDQHVVGTFV